jgi:hypothetical protein
LVQEQNEKNREWHKKKQVLSGTGNGFVYGLSGFFSLDKPAKGTGVLSIKCFAQRLGEAVRF